MDIFPYNATFKNKLVRRLKFCPFIKLWMKSNTSIVIQEMSFKQYEKRDIGEWVMYLNSKMIDPKNVRFQGGKAEFLIAPIALIVCWLSMIVIDCRWLSLIVCIFLHWKKVSWKFYSSHKLSVLDGHGRDHIFLVSVLVSSCLAIEILFPINMMWL